MSHRVSIQWLHQFVEKLHKSERSGACYSLHYLHLDNVGNPLLENILLKRPTSCYETDRIN